ncbi:MAG TPA: LptF/LptG family permease [Pyrinomonadaceae bacterium]|nr:LptF/LptG family permease [Pyrinomonadaceae bacterium]
MRTKPEKIGERRFSKSIAVYIFRSLLPYVIISWLLLTAILFIQQASRYSDIFFNANIPSSLVWRLSLALLPGVTAFTAPMSALVGIVIGFSKMSGDREITSCRAAGLSNSVLMLPAAVIGILLSVFTFLVNLYGVPIAASIVRNTAMKAAITKLEMPIEPGVFNSDIAGFTIYVSGESNQTGKWNGILLVSDTDSAGGMRVITAESGRIDSSGQLSELVLEKGISTFFTSTPNGEKIVSERIGQVRVAIKTKKAELIDKMAQAESALEELGIRELTRIAFGASQKDALEAGILLQRRIALSLLPIFLAIFGSLLALRSRRGGRGYGLMLSLVGLIVYYFIAFSSEQLARTQVISPLTAALIPLGALGSVSTLLYLDNRTAINGILERVFDFVVKLAGKFRKLGVRWTDFLDQTTGLRDFDIASNIVRFYFFAFTFLAALYLIFTAFELWRFAGTMPNGVELLGKYLFFLIPFVYLSLTSASIFIAVLATFTLKSRNNELVAWTSSGVSVYRILAPAIIVAVIFGIINFGIQEYIAPKANLIQDEYRESIRSRGSYDRLKQRFWVADGSRIFAFSPSPKTGLVNNKEAANVYVLEMDKDEFSLKSVLRSQNSRYELGQVTLEPPVKIARVYNGSVENSISASPVTVSTESDPFAALRRKPSQINAFEARSRADSAESETEKVIFEFSVHKKWTTLFVPLVITLFTAPLAVSLNLRRKSFPLATALILWLAFMGTISLFEQLALAGQMSTAAAGWLPIVLFGLAGIFLVSRTQT